MTWIAGFLLFCSMYIDSLVLKALLYLIINIIIAIQDIATDGWTVKLFSH